MAEILFTARHELGQRPSRLFHLLDCDFYCNWKEQDGALRRGDGGPVFPKWDFLLRLSASFEGKAESRSITLY